MIRIFKTLLELTVFILCVYFILTLLFIGTYFVLDKYTPYDDSDAPCKRSGFKVMTDYKTGLQYLKAGSAVTPRLDITGKQIRKGE